MARSPRNEAPKETPTAQLSASEKPEAWQTQYNEGMTGLQTVMAAQRLNTYDRNRDSWKVFTAFAALAAAGKTTPAAFWADYFKHVNPQGKTYNADADVNKNRIDDCTSIAMAAKVDLQRLLDCWPAPTKTKTFLSRQGFIDCARKIVKGDPRSAEAIREDVRGGDKSFLGALTTLCERFERVKAKHDDQWDMIADEYMRIDKLRRKLKDEAKAASEEPEKAAA